MKKVYRKKGEGGSEYQVIPKELFRLTVQKFFVEESFSVSLNSCTKKVYGSEELKEEGSINTIHRNFFDSQSRKKIWGESFSVSLCSVIKKNYR